MRIKEAYDDDRSTALTFTTKLFLFGGAYEVYDNGTTISTKKYYSIAGMIVAMDDGTDVVYFAADHLSSASVVMDSIGDLVSENRYMPFGEVREIAGRTEITETDFGYTNQRNYAMMGLMDYDARFYSPALGRFTQPDSIVPDLTNSQAWNRYSYVNNSPIMYVDPSGHMMENGSTGGIADEDTLQRVLDDLDLDHQESYCNASSSSGNGGGEGDSTDQPNYPRINITEPEYDIDFTSYDPAGPYYVSAIALEGETSYGMLITILMTVHSYQVNVLAIENYGEYSLTITEKLSGTSGVQGYEADVYTALSVLYEDGSISTTPLSIYTIGLWEYTNEETTKLQFDNIPVAATIRIEIINPNALTIPPNEFFYPIAIP